MGFVQAASRKMDFNGIRRHGGHTKWVMRKTYRRNAMTTEEYWRHNRYLRGYSQVQSISAYDKLGDAFGQTRATLPGRARETETETEEKKDLIIR